MPSPESTQVVGVLVCYAGLNPERMMRLQAIYAIAAVELGQLPLAHRLFNTSYQRFNFPPFFTWSEKQDGTGNVPYLTSGGGFLQSIIHGFAGLRVLAGRLRLRPVLLEGVRRMALRRIFYCGRRLDVEYNATVATISVAEGGGRPKGSGGHRAQGPASEKGAAVLRFVTEGKGGDGGSPLPAVFPTGTVVYVLCPPGQLST